MGWCLCSPVERGMGAVQNLEQFVSVQRDLGINRLQRVRHIYWSSVIER
jgi:hypothetical protein